MTLGSETSTAVTLLGVCRASSKWLSPFVYRSVTLTRPHTILRFAKTVTTNPLLGTYVHTLWIGPSSIHKIEQFSTPCMTSCRAERERSSYPFARALYRILTRCQSIAHLALIHIPLVSISQWMHTEHALPPNLQTLVMGPDHAMLGSPEFYRSLKHLISIETTLVQVELANIIAFPQLSTLEWIFVPHSGTMKLERSDPEKFWEKLIALLNSDSLRHVRVVRMEDKISSISLREENDGHLRNRDSHDDDWTMETNPRNTGALPRSKQCLVVNNAQGHRVKLEFPRRSCAGKSNDWVSHFLNEWKKSTMCYPHSIPFE